MLIESHLWNYSRGLPASNPKDPLPTDFRVFQPGIGPVITCPGEDRNEAVPVLHSRLRPMIGPARRVNQCNALKSADETRDPEGKFLLLTEGRRINMSR